MIPADKNRFIARWLAGDAEKRIRRSFARSCVAGLPQLRAALAQGPVLIVTNHTSWWDPIVLQWLTLRVLGTDAYALMDAKNLAKLPFFRKVGAFGVDLEDPRDGVRAMRYAAKLLDRPRRVVWIFPQGTEVPITRRPLGFRPGAAIIARFAKTATVIPGAFRYEHGKDPLPVLWMSFGPAIRREPDPERARTAQEEAVTRELDRIDRAILDVDESGFEYLHRTQPGVFFRVAQAALAWLTR